MQAWHMDGEEGLAQRTWDWQCSFKKTLARPTPRSRAKTLWRFPPWAEMARPTSPALLRYWLAACRKHCLYSDVMTDPEDEMIWRLWTNSTHWGKFALKGRSEQDALRLRCVLKKTKVGSLTCYMKRYVAVLIMVVYIGTGISRTECRAPEQTHKCMLKVANGQAIHVISSGIEDITWAGGGGNETGSLLNILVYILVAHCVQ